MNEHPDVELLALYAGGELVARERHALTAHLRVCDDCQRELAELQSTRQLLARALPEPSDIDVRAVRDSLVRRLRLVPTTDHRMWRWAGAFAAVAFTIVAFAVNRKELAPAMRMAEQTAQSQSLPLLVGPTLELPLQELHRVRVRRRRPGGGIRDVALLARRDGPSQLKLSTADPNVVILIDLNGATPNP